MTCDTIVSSPTLVRRNLHRRGLLKAALASAGLAAGGIPVLATTGDGSLLATYQAFVTAQNAGDLDAVHALFTSDPPFLWVSDGMSVWGRDAAIARMSLFRASEVWHVTPDLARAVPVALDERTAYLHLPLDLEIGARAKPDRLPFLVSMLCHRDLASGPWRIAALFTTTRKPS